MDEKLKKKYEWVLNESYLLILNLTDGESDPEMQKYNDDILDGLNEIKSFIENQ